MSHPAVGPIVSCYFVVPSLKVSGGTREVLRLGARLTNQRCRASLISMWNSPHSIPSTLSVHLLSHRAPNAALAILELPILFLRFVRLVLLLKRARVGGPGYFVFTHYATLPLSLLVPRKRRLFFVQDLEWKFVGNSVLSRMLRALIIWFYRTGKLISANSYLTRSLEKMQLDVAIEAPIWADRDFLSPTCGQRDIDYVMMLRKGPHKRLDLYLAFIDIATKHANVKVAVISPEDHLVRAVQDKVAVSLLRPSLGDMRALYARSRCFVHLSDHEGFGLPPLEAMGAGCVPICRDSGGVRIFMVDSLASMLFPLDVSTEEIFHAAQDLLADEPRLRALSSIARDIFDRGLVAASETSIDTGQLLGVN